MQRWEYRVVSLRDGTYTQSLNAYGQDGWELVGVAPDAPAEGAAAPARSGGLPMPRALGRLEDAAAMVERIGGSGGDEAAAQPAPTPLLWVLKRPLPDDG